MNEALAYSQSDYYKKIKQRVVIAALPLLDNLNQINLNTLSNDSDKIERYISQNIPSLNAIAIAALSFAEKKAQVDNELLDWLINLYNTINIKIIETPYLDKLPTEQADQIKNIADDLAHSIPIIDLFNSKSIKNTLKTHGFSLNA